MCVCWSQLPFTESMAVRCRFDMDDYIRLLEIKQYLLTVEYELYIEVYARKYCPQHQ